MTDTSIADLIIKQGFIEQRLTELKSDENRYAGGNLQSHQKKQLADIRRDRAGEYEQLAAISRQIADWFDPPADASGTQRS